MRIVFTILLLVGGIGLCLFHVITCAVVNSRSLKLYRDKVDSIPNKDSYTRAEVSEAAWQVWTNQQHLTAKDSYTVAELQEGVLGLGARRDSFDRGTLESIIGSAAGYKQNESPGTLIPGVLAMLAGSFSLGGIMFPTNGKKVA